MLECLVVKIFLATSSQANSPYLSIPRCAPSLYLHSLEADPSGDLCIHTSAITWLESITYTHAPQNSCLQCWQWAWWEVSTDLMPWPGISRSRAAAGGCSCGSSILLCRCTSSCPPRSSQILLRSALGQFVCHLNDRRRWTWNCALNCPWQLLFQIKCLHQPHVSLSSFSSWPAFTWRNISD